MQLNTLLAFLFVVVAGIALAVQAPLNANMGRIIGGPYAATLVTFVVSTFIILIMNAYSGSLENMARVIELPWWAWLGGVAGPVYMMAVITSVPRLGVLTTFSTLVAGQVAAAVALDSIGAFGAPLQPLSLSRVFAVLLVCSGVYMSRA